VGGSEVELDAYNFQSFAHHKHHVGIDDHRRVFDQVAGDHYKDHGMSLDEGFG
jgi:hypothetical protein